MKTLASPLIIFLGVMLPSRLGTVISFSPTATRAQVTETMSSLSTITLKSMALRGQANGEDNSNGRKSSVAIIGGGIAGLSCARHLQHRFDVTVVSSNQSGFFGNIFETKKTDNLFSTQYLCYNSLFL